MFVKVRVCLDKGFLDTADKASDTTVDACPDDLSLDNLTVSCCQINLFKCSLVVNSLAIDPSFAHIYDLFLIP